MREHHCQGFRSMAGESLRYAAVFQDQWLALLGWSAAALSCKVRDQWIGWSPQLQGSRLPLGVNNSRFLILPDVRVPNLAPRILSLNVKRLSLDWTKVLGHPVWLAETFVDPRHFKGACYKAAGWVSVGHTLGFRRTSGGYLFHDHPKIVFVRPLHLRAQEFLSDPHPEANPYPELKPTELSAKQAHALIERLSAVPDPRRPRGRRHKMISVLAISLCGIMSNARSFAPIAEWARRCPQKMLKRLYCRYDPQKHCYVPPSEPAIRRNLRAVDADAVDQSLCGWWTHSDDAISVDGKTVRGGTTGRRTPSPSPQRFSPKPGCRDRSTAG